MSDDDDDPRKRREEAQAQEEQKAPIGLEEFLRLVEEKDPTLEVIYYDTITLEKKDDEKTAVRFSILGDGKVANINHVAKSLVNKAFKRE